MSKSKREGKGTQVTKNQVRATDGDGGVAAEFLAGVPEAFIAKMGKAMGGLSVEDVRRSLPLMQAVEQRWTTSKERVQADEDERRNKHALHQLEVTETRAKFHLPQNTRIGDQWSLIPGEVYEDSPNPFWRLVALAMILRICWKRRNIEAGPKTPMKLQEATKPLMDNVLDCLITGFKMKSKLDNLMGNLKVETLQRIWEAIRRAARTSNPAAVTIVALSNDVIGTWIGELRAGDTSELKEVAADPKKAFELVVIPESVPEQTVNLANRLEQIRAARVAKRGQTPTISGPIALPAPDDDLTDSPAEE